MGAISKRWFGIQTGEGFRAWRMFTIVFMLIASLAIIKPVRNSLFLNEYGVSHLPYAFLLVALVSSIFAFSYSRLSKRFNLHILIQTTLFTSILSVILFWLLIRDDLGQGWIYYLLYVWGAIFGLITTTQFWLLANYVFLPRQAKRLFGFLGAGAISGGIFGGYLTRLLAEPIGTKNMLLFCVLFLLIGAWLVRDVWSRSEREIEERFKSRNRQERQLLSSKVSPWKRIYQIRLLRYTAALVGIGVLVANLVDYQFSAISSDAIRDEDELTAFFGFWLSSLSLLSLAFQLFGTNRIIKRYGVGASLYVLPTGILFGTLAVVGWPVLWAAVLVKVSDGSFKQSINKAGLELLALPIPTSIKNQTKAIIDVFVDHFATGVGGVLLILCTRVFEMGVREISLLIVLVLLIWLRLIRLVKREYVQAFRLAIEKRTLDLNLESIDLNDAAVQESLLKALEDQNPRKVLYVLDLIDNTRIDHARLPLSDLLDHPDLDVRAKALKMATGNESIDLSERAHLLLENAEGDMRIAALVYLVSKNGNGTELIREWIAKGSVSQRADAILATGRLVRDFPELRNQLDIVTFLQSLLDFTLDEKLALVERSRLRRAAAQAISEASDPAQHTYLHTLLHDKETDVLIAAVSAAGATHASEFVPALVRHLGTKLVRHAAREALSQYGKQVIPYLIERFENPQETDQVRYGIAQVLGMIGTQEAVDTLIHFLKDETSIMIRDRVIRSLNRLKKRFPQLHFTHNAIDHAILRQIDEYKSISQSLVVVRTVHVLTADIGLKQARSLLIRALGERLDADFERIFRLLGLRYSGRQMFDAYLSIIGTKAELSDSAVEFLDSLLDRKVKKALLPILDATHDEYTAQTQLESAERAKAVERELLVEMANGADPWLAASALFVMQQLGKPEWAHSCTDLVNHPVPLVAETARKLTIPARSTIDS